MNEPLHMIAHLDLDAFFVEVECLNNPGLRGKPLIVGGSRDRGVVTTCSYEARKFGVHSAMPMKKAMQLCPEAVLLRGTRGEYSRFSRWVTDIIASRAPLFEKASIDEFYVDLGGMERFFDPLDWTIALRKEIMDQTKLPISFGIASNKMVAKMATNEAKPNGYLQILPGKEMEFLGPLSPSKIPGVGESTQRVLQEMGIQSIAELVAYPREILAQRLGSRFGEDLWARANGQHTSTIHAYHEAKSISTENTFEDNVGDTDFLHSELVRMTEKIAYQLREENKMTGCITVKIRYPDFETTSRQSSISYTCYDDELIPAAKELFQQLYRRGEKVRLLGVRLSELTNEARQTNLFSDEQKKSGLYKAIDQVKGRFGKGSLTRGGAV
ncbi:MAG: DNA polymerase IV [Chitinophagaceae bacterium]|nr:DNA polymerase IV [Chitinophagaceae bacterium]